MFLFRSSTFKTFTALFIIYCVSIIIPDAEESNTITYFSSLEKAFPFHTSQDQIIKHYAYILKYNENYEQADWITYFLSDERLKGTIDRTDDFREDTAVSTGTASLEDYRGSNYDRGHLAPAADMRWLKQAMTESFLFSNMSPQSPGFNRGVWRRLEELIRKFALKNKEIYVVTGPVLKGDLPTIGENEVAIPEFYYKVILDLKTPDFKGIGFILPHASSSADLQTYAVCIDSVESFTDIDFFPELPDSLEIIIEKNSDFSKWLLDSPEEPNSETQPMQAVQCKGITRNGTRCTRMTTNPNGYCWQHQDQADE